MTAPVQQRTHPRRIAKLLPLSGEERDLFHSVGLSDEQAIDANGVPARAAGAPPRRVLPPGVAARVAVARAGAHNGPTPDAAARLEAALEQTMTGGTSPYRNPV
jgi:hypothetical protein